MSIHSRKPRLPIAMFHAIAAMMVWAMAGAAAAAQSAGSETMPEIIPDDSAGDWVVDRFAGNSTAGPEFFPGPAREVGGLGRCGACPLPDGRVLLPLASGLAEVDRDGTLQLLGAATAQGETAHVTAGVAVYGPADRQVYLGGQNCVRRLSERRDGVCSVEVIAGTPGRSGHEDGPCSRATFGRIGSLVVNGRGTIFVLDSDERLRKIEGGRVTTLNKNFHSGRQIDGPLSEAAFNLVGLGGNICLGENDDVLYVSDHWNFCVRKIDLGRGVVSTVAGMPKPAPSKPELQNAQHRRYGRNSDGPALTWASFNSGCAYACYDPIHQALWCGGPDEQRLRWLRGGEVRTVAGAKPDDNWAKDGLGIPAEKAIFNWNAVVAVDLQGRAYVSCSGQPNGIWRVYRRKEMTR